MEQTLSRRTDLEAEIRELVPRWSLGVLVDALQALRGVALVMAVTLVAEVGDMRRFSNPKQLMAYLGVTPGEHSSGAAFDHAASRRRATAPCEGYFTRRLGATG